MQKKSTGAFGGAMGGKEFGKAQGKLQGMMDIYSDLGDSPAKPAAHPKPIGGSSKPSLSSKQVTNIKSPVYHGVGSTGTKPSAPKVTSSHAVAGGGIFGQSVTSPVSVTSKNLTGSKGTITQDSIQTFVSQMKAVTKPLSPDLGSLISQRNVLDKPGLKLYDFTEGGAVNEVITDQEINSQYSMAKAKDLYENPTISSNITPSNLRQGNVGDCYILGSLSVVANHPENIKRLMEDKQADVEAWLCDSGCWKKIIMSMTFPVSNGRPTFASSKNNCIWQMILEKAFACMYKGYERLELGHSSVAMSELTGCATEYIELENPQEAWVNIQSFLDKKYVITGSSKITGLSSTTITPKHCYAVLGAKEVTYQNRKIKYLSLMNPMSQWAEPPGLPAEVAKQLSPQTHDVFWYQFASVLKDFEVLTCCKIKPELTYSWSRVKNTGQQSKTAVFRLIGTPGDSLSISFNHKNLRHYIKQSLDSIMKTKYAVTRVIAFTFNKSGGIDVLGYGFHSLHSIRMDLDLNSSEVFLFIDIDYAQQHTDEYTVSASAKSPVVFQREHGLENFLNTGSNKATMIKVLLYQTALNQKTIQVSKNTPLRFTTHEYKHKIHGAQPTLLRFYGQALGYVSFVYQNGTKNCTLRETFSPTEMKNVTEYLPKGLKDFTLLLPPDTGEVVVLKFGPENNCSHVSRIGTTSELHF